MNTPTGLLQAIQAGLLQEIQEFCNTHIYSGYTAPFRIIAIQPFHLNPSVIQIVPEGVDEEIEEEDKAWERSLAELGERFGVSLCLHYRSYGK